MMRINTIAVWNAGGEVRRIDLKAGLNIVTGESETGKSTLIDIISYCLGGGTFRVPQGPIAQSVVYYGLLVTINTTDAFLGRPALPEGQQSSSRAQLEIGQTDLPDFEALSPTTSADDMQAWVAAQVGIEENRFEPPAHASRRPLVAKLDHALVHCFQSQDEIASRKILFHRAGEDYLPQAIRDTLPYFLGVTGPEELRLAADLRELQRNLRETIRLRQQNDETLADGLQEALALLSQAADAGIRAVEEPPDTVAQALVRLAEVRIAPVPAAPRQPPGEEFDRLHADRARLLARMRAVREQRQLARAIALGGSDLERESIEQIVRLQPVGVLANPGEPAQCPVCHEPLSAPIPEVDTMLNALTELDQQIIAVERERPNLVEVQEQLGILEETVKGELEGNRRALDRLAASAQAVAAHAQTLDLVAYVRGRVDQYLEKAVGASDERGGALRSAEADLQREIGEIEQRLDPERVRDQATSVLVSIGRQWMTPMAQQLGLEHSSTGVRIDLGRLTVVADTPQGAVYMDTGIGSAKNWVGYHLASVLSLQQHFVVENRPVPSFLVLDQPTQAFFPSDQATEQASDQDRQDALAQFALVRDIADRLDGRLQIIVLDHADFDEPWFDGAVIERWRDGNALIPSSWYGPSELDPES
jgi:hypothetical protein